MPQHEDFRIPKTEFMGAKLVRSLRGVENPSVFDAGAGGVVSVLAIIGLSGAAPRAMAALAFVGVGIAFAVEAAGIAKRSRRLLTSHSPIRGELDASVLGESAAGVAGFVFAMLALFGVAPFVMLPIASVSFGVALSFGTGAALQVDTIATHLEPSTTRRVIHEAVVGASGARLLIAATSIVLGLLALAGVERATLVLTAGLVLGVALLLGAASLGDRMHSSRKTSATLS